MNKIKFDVITLVAIFLLGISVTLLMGANAADPGPYQISVSEDYVWIIDAKTGNVWKLTHTKEWSHMGKPSLSGRTSAEASSY